MHFWNLFQIWYFKLYKNSNEYKSTHSFVSSKALLRPTMCWVQIQTQREHSSGHLKQTSHSPEAALLSTTPATDSRKVHAMLPEMPSAAGAKRQNNPNEQRIWRCTSPKKICKWPTSGLANAEALHPWLLWKRKSGLQWDISSHPIGWL